MKFCGCCQWVVFLLHYEGSIHYASLSFCWTAPNSPGQKHHHLSFCLCWLTIFFLIQKRHYFSLGLCWLTVNLPIQKHHYLSLGLCWLAQSFPIHYYASLLITRLLLAHPKLSKTKACRLNNCGLTQNFPRQKQSYFVDLPQTLHDKSIVTFPLTPVDLPKHFQNKSGVTFPSAPVDLPKPFQDNSIITFHCTSVDLPIIIFPRQKHHYLSLGPCGFAPSFHDKGIIDSNAADYVALFLENRYISHDLKSPAPLCKRVCVYIYIYHHYSFSGHSTFITMPLRQSTPQESSFMHQA